MARTKEAPVSVAGYFREYFTAHPESLKGKSNKEVLSQWKVDHPGEKLTAKIKANMANTKSQVRKKLGMRKRYRRKGQAVAQSPVNHRISGAVLETLEIQIDSLLAVARHYEASGLEAVVKHLRDARNGVVMKQA